MGIFQTTLQEEICGMMIPLKEATAAKHKEAERMPFNVRMFRGELSHNDYLLYLYQQLEIFRNIERHELPHPDLSRVSATEKDIAELEEQGFSANTLLPATLAYCQHLSRLNQEALLPHVYLNYLALMFGGQMIKRSIPSSGAMYNFVNMDDCLQAVRRVQKDEWADEVNLAFEYLISIFRELDKNNPQTQSA